MLSCLGIYQNDNIMSISEVRPRRTPAGDAFTDLVVEVAWLGGMFTAAGEALARTADQTLARWVILDAIEGEPATVAQVAPARYRPPGSATRRGPAGARRPDRLRTQPQTP